MAGTHNDPIALNDEMDDDEALRYAIALSLQEENQSVAPDPVPAESPKREPQGGASFGSLILDRKKMEEERLQRLAKRRRSDTKDEAPEEPAAKRKPTPAAFSPARPLPFVRGAVKRTWARGYPRTIDDIKIEEVFQKDQLLLAVLSSFQWDDEWLMSKLDMTKTKVLLMAYASDEAQKTAMRSNAPPGIRFCFPPMNGPGSMHSKLQVLKFPDYLRIVVPTGNLVPYDWGETGVMENMVFLIDLPRLANVSEHQQTTFSIELGRFLTAAGVDDAMVRGLNNYDFSQTTDLGFVYSIPGGHTGDSSRQIGYCGLGASVTSLGLSTNDPIEVDLVSASLGSVNYDLINAIYNACRGDDGMTEYNSRISRRSRAKGGPSTSSQPLRPLREHFRIYFPTDATVGRSRGGRSAAGTICAQERWWRAPTFPSELVRDCVNTRDGLLMHSKLIFVRKSNDVELKAGSSPAWAYVGSANLSESAWGRLVKDRGTGRPKMTCRNWECGVVVRVPGLDVDVDKKTPAEGQGKGRGKGLEVFNGRVPVPMVSPAQAYGPADQPWFYRPERGS